MKAIDAEKLFALAGDRALELESALHKFARLLYRHWDLKVFFEDEGVPAENKKKLFAKIYPAESGLFRELIYLLIDEELAQKIVRLSEKFTRIVSGKLKVTFVEVKSAFPLNEGEKRGIENFFGGRARLREELVPEMISGFSALAGDGRFFDASLSGAIGKMKESLIYVR